MKSICVFLNEILNFLKLHMIKCWIWRFANYNSRAVKYVCHRFKKTSDLRSEGRSASCRVVSDGKICRGRFALAICFKILYFENCICLTYTSVVFICPFVRPIRQLARWASKASQTTCLELESKSKVRWCQIYLSAFIPVTMQMLFIWIFVKYCLSVFAGNSCSIVPKI